ncbi:unnamed protein product [Didymodactylos carnosus]|uniref:RING-type domain-containing protein n=1 Tax=Didymodactylos carnosus TaxID=1234261 RepID=A0A8S2QAP4_9BILA|nr:unnamed protein product [Didymodactylos carnosus]CAF4098054.1 unnamed protein product [Didymodactylos carnosus]
MAINCEFEFMEYVDEDNIDSNLICSICQKPFKEPVCTPCDHTYGRICISQWLDQNNHDSCPICIKQPLSINDFIQASRPLRCMLDQLRVRCILCGETNIQRGNFGDHINKICPEAIVECQAVDIKCPWKGTRNKLHDHVAACIFEPLRPILALLIVQNRQLTDQVQKHDNEIKNLKEKVSQFTNTANASDDENDASSVSEFSTDQNQKEEDAIFVRYLPATVKFNDVFGLFSKVGRIKYNTKTQKADIFIFKNPNNKNGQCNAKVTYMDKESAAAAIAEYNTEKTGIPEAPRAQPETTNKPKKVSNVVDQSPILTNPDPPKIKKKSV